jgi:hypothetical protein
MNSSFLYTSGLSSRAQIGSMTCHVVGAAGPG